MSNRLKLSVLLVAGVALVVAAGVFLVARRRESDLFFAAARGDEDEIARLLAAGATGSHRNWTGSGPLHAAAVSGNAEAAKLLLHSGMDVDVTDKVGFTPLHFAAAMGDSEMVALLLEAGANVNQATHDPTVSFDGGPTRHDGLTPLHCAAGRHATAAWPLRDYWQRGEEHNRVIRILLRAGADVNAKDGTRGTPLHAAVLAEYYEGVVLLVEAGADVAARDNGRMTAGDMAQHRSDRRIRALLLAAEATPYSPHTPTAPTSGDDADATPE